MDGSAVITVLSTTTPGAAMTKKLTLTNEGWTKEGYARAYRFDVARLEVHNLADLSELLTDLEGLPEACVIRGKPIEGMPTRGVYRLLHPDLEKQRPAFFEQDADGVQWLMLDFDAVPAPEGLTTTRERLDYLVSLLPPFFHDVSFHYQWSAGAGLDGWETISGHLWFWLSEPWTDSLLIERIEIEKWECDEAPIRTVQPNYTAAPIFENAPDFLAGERSGLVLKRLIEVDLPPFARPKPAPRFDGSKPLVVGKPFEQRLADIGPRFHMPINRAIASYVATHGLNTDTFDLKDMIRTAVNTCGYAAPSIYTKEDYLDQSIKGAMRKFARVF